MKTSLRNNRHRRRGFLNGLEFLTGEDTSAGSLLLVVGMVTCVLIAGFQFLLNSPISTLLTVLVRSSLSSASSSVRCWIARSL